MKIDIDQAELNLIKQYLKYDTENDQFIWIQQPSARVKLGSIAGSYNPSRKEYNIGFNYKFYSINRLRVLFTKGLIPKNRLIQAIEYAHQIEVEYNDLFNKQLKQKEQSYA